jgi:hypothetical protein
MAMVLLTCRAGELLFTLAKAFPRGRYHGYDISQQSVDAANKRCVAGLQSLLFNMNNPHTCDAECLFALGAKQMPTCLHILTSDPCHPACLAMSNIETSSM